MFVEENIEQFGNTQPANKVPPSEIKGRLAKKEKKICKPFEKIVERHPKGKEFSKVEKLCYARLLLTSIIHSITIGTEFFEYVAQDLSRKPQEIYSFHRKMISEFRTKRSIVKELLGSEVETPKRQNGF